jgi:hypothetical protein
MVGPYDDAYKAIGRYVAEFSQLVATMRNLLATRIAGQEDVDRDLVELSRAGLDGGGVCRFPIFI